MVIANIWTVGVIVLLLNIPFGYWRANTVRFSRQWFLSVHLPVPAIILLRIVSGLGFHMATFPVMIISFFLGQLLGGKIFLFRLESQKTPLTSCLVMDLIRGRGK